MDVAYAHGCAGARHARHVVGTLLVLLPVLWSPGAVLAADKEGPELSEAVALVTNSSNNLVPALFKELSVPGENLVVAPFGVAVNLGMVLEGARGAAASELRTALGVNETQSETLRTGFRAVLARFQATADHEDVSGAFTEATLHSSRRLPDQYRSLLEDYYLASLSTELDTTNNISSNDLAENDTLVLSLSSDTGVMSHWRDFHLLPVYVLLSHQAAAPFTRGPKDVVTVPMVPLVGVFRFGRVTVTPGKGRSGLSCWVVEVPLEARGTSLVLLLPETAGATAVSEAVSWLSPRVPRLVAKLPPTEMEVLLPQLAAVSRGKDLRPALRALGVHTVLDTSLRQHVSSVTQDAFVSTSFVAINSVSSVGSRLAERLDRRRRRRRRRRQANDADLTPRLVLDRPFAFYVVHDAELILLAGTVSSPAQVPASPSAASAAASTTASSAAPPTAPSATPSASPATATTPAASSGEQISQDPVRTSDGETKVA